MVDASFAVHPDFRSHTGGCMTWGRGTPISMSIKQKLNSRSSTESELIGLDDLMDKVIWTKLFLADQGIHLNKNMVAQDNQSAMKLEKNGRASAGKRTRALNIRYFFVTDQIKKGNLTIEYQPTESMVANFMTKPLQGKVFQKFRDKLLGMEEKN